MIWQNRDSVISHSTPIETDRTRILTCDISTDMLTQLAQQVIDGSLIPECADVPIFRWRIFLPTRRAVRRLQGLFHALQMDRAIVLPRIMPIGDIDEDMLANDGLGADVPEAISDLGLLFDVMTLLSQWSHDHLETSAIARDIAGSMTRIQHLAESLVELLTQGDIEERSFDGIAAVFDRDLAGHRQTILDLLDVINVKLPDRLAHRNLIRPAARRNLLIRKQAADLRRRQSRDPVIIAGSTGTNPATRDLIKAIAERPSGCVILPGLDTVLADSDWLALAATHSQYNLRSLLQTLEVARSEVGVFGHATPDRAWLAREIMRPTESVDHWLETIAENRTPFARAMQDLQLIEAPDRHMEARAIALVLREAQHHGHSSIALITPDRDLAIRVKVELRRWAIEADDTRGESLAAQGQAHLLSLIAAHVLSDFSAQTLVAILHDRHANFGMAEDDVAVARQILEFHVLRQQGLGLGLNGLRQGLLRAELTLAADAARHRTRSVTDGEWTLAKALTVRLESAFRAFVDSDEKLLLGVHVTRLQDCLGVVTGDQWAATPEGLELATALAAVKDEERLLPDVQFAESVPLIFTKLAKVIVRPVPRPSARIGIYGLLEARLMQFDVAVLGGLNEGKWPATADAGPWLNRPMRHDFDLQQPERDIGLTAHDFVDALGYAKIYLTWAKRIGTEPVLPSRWVLRLRTVMEAGGIAEAKHCDTTHITLAHMIDRPDDFNSCERPWPTPPVAARPRSFSVTEIERLIRDPYAVYARRMLNLRPLSPLAEAPDRRLRGILFHHALKDWSMASPSGRAAPLAMLLEAGERVFEPLRDDDVMTFWRPRFQRMATWFADQEEDLRSNLHMLHAEIRGALTLTIVGDVFTLTAIADRMDVLTDGSVRIIDYKTGIVPTNNQVRSGLSPQLTLEAAMVKRGSFTAVGARTVSAACYIKISGGRVPGEITFLGQGKKTNDPGKGKTAKDQFSVSDVADLHFEKLTQKLATLLVHDTAFPPRVAVMKDKDKSDYDHLSRYLEWSLSR